MLIPANYIYAATNYEANGSARFTIDDVTTGTHDVIFVYTFAGQTMDAYYDGTPLNI